MGDSPPPAPLCSADVWPRPLLQATPICFTLTTPPPPGHAPSVPGSARLPALATPLPPGHAPLSNHAYLRHFSPPLPQATPPDRACLHTLTTPQTRATPTCLHVATPPFRPRPHRAPKPGCVPKGAWLQKGAWPSSGSSALPPQMCGAVPGLLYGGTCGAVMGQDPHLRGTYGAERGTYGAQHPKWDTSGAE